MDRPEKGSKASFGSNTSYEEGDVIDYDLFTKDEKPEAPTHTKEYYFQEYPYVRPTQSDFDRKEIEGTKLFDKKKDIEKEAKTSVQDVVEEDIPGHRTSILVTGFGMRNVDSFQRLIHMSHEEREKWELKKLWRDSLGKSEADKEEERFRKYQEQLASSARTEESGTSTSKKSSSDLLTQTDATFRTDTAMDHIKHLDYLLGLESAGAEEWIEEVVSIETEESEDGFKYSSSKSVREAQRYLRVHRIFECFQFIVAHLLSAKSENPIEVILNLLNRCILFRSGLGEAPLLYERKHIGKLFELMDRFQTGVISMNQYVTGMKTFGICTYNEEPDVTDEGMVTKETFIDEAYDAELAIFDDIIKKRVEKSKPKMKRAPAGLDSISIPSLSPPYFIPSELFKFSKQGMDDHAGIDDQIDG